MARTKTGSGAQPTADSSVIDLTFDSRNAIVLVVFYAYYSGCGVSFVVRIDRAE